MAPSVVLCVAVATLMVVTAKTHPAVEMRHHYEPTNDRGYFTKCNPEDAQNFTLWWEPKKISTKGTITAFLEFKSVFYWNGGFARANIKINGNQFLMTRKPVNCNKIEGVLPNIKCPVEIGEIVKPSDPFIQSAKMLIPGVIVDLKLELLDHQKKTLICAKGHIIVEEDDDDDY